MPTRVAIGSVLLTLTTVARAVPSPIPAVSSCLPDSATALVVMQGPTTADEFYVGPFVQNVTTSSAWIVWESDTGSESRVEFGTAAEQLDRSATGTSIASEGSRRIHSVPLGRLSPDTRYYYRVVTGGQTSEVAWFRTPAPASAEKPFRFAAVSDTQTDSNHDDKLVEIVNDGIIAHLHNTHAGDLTDNLAFLLLAGDVVDAGSNYGQWKVEFFDEAANLLRHVPLYPVPGNHEQDSHWYFDYFVLPENGTEGYLEHWYYTDYGNVRIIGLDSNSGYRVQAQLDWLDGVLDDAATNDDIDFVFAQLHHPHKSELWLPGELDYSGDIVARLEAFSTETGKPSAHFFGHTHGYSRGQSRDHQHLWVNVASGEGNLDYWGEYPQADYPEFQYSVPDYGFMIVDVEAGSDPKFRLQRYSRGTEFTTRDNELIDEITVRRVNAAPMRPSTALPLDGATGVSPDRLTLSAGAFADADGDAHWESHFQVTAIPGDYSDPVEDKWIRFENWYSPPDASGPSTGYYSVNTVTDPDISRVDAERLEPRTTYAWRVRYRDEGLVWSEWSEEAVFTTGDSVGSDNLLVNPGAEQGTEGWTTTEGTLESLEANQCGSETSPAEGSRFFAVGGVCENESEYGEAVQRISLEDYRDDIDDGDLRVLFGGMLKDFAGEDRPEIWLTFLSQRLTVLGSTARLGSQSRTWERVEATATVPPTTWHVDVHVSGTRHAGTDNDSYADALEFRVLPDTPCIADFNHDGTVDTQDFLAFLNAWNLGEAGADVDGDGVVDSRDVLTFLNLWVTGC